MSGPASERDAAASTSMANEEKKRLAYERQNAVRQAWKEEQSRVRVGHGTRNWSAEEQEELLERGSVQGYEGHHMKSVSLYPEYAGDSKNIQFLTEDEHLYGAHNGSYHNLTNGYYDPETKEMHEFGDKLEDLPDHDLTQNDAESYLNSESEGQGYTSGSEGEGQGEFDGMHH